MKLTLIASAVLLALPLTALAADPAPAGWSGSGEAGLAIASGNTKSQNLNAKLDIKFNDDRWTDDFYLLAIRNESNVTVTTIDTTTTPATVTTSSHNNLTASHYEAGASFGYKFDAKSYLVGALRYERDRFSPFDYDYTASIGYGYQALKDASNELAFEVGAGYKVMQPTTYDVFVPGPPPVLLVVNPDSESGAVFRGKVDYKHNFSASTSFVDTLLAEAGSGNTYVENDAGLVVKMTDKMALKAGYQVRHNTDVLPGFKKTDQLLTTNLVYSF